MQPRSADYEAGTMGGYGGVGYGGGAPSPAALTSAAGAGAAPADGTSWIGAAGNLLRGISTAFVRTESAE